MDENLRFSYFSDRFTEVTGVPNEMLLGKTREEAGIPDTDPEAWNVHLADLAAHRSFRDFRHPRQHPERGTVHLSINGKAIFDEAGNFRGYRGTGSDISDRKRAEWELEESRERLRAVFDNTPVCLNLKDTEGRYILVNKPYEEWLGRPAEEIIGKKASDFLGQKEEVENLTLAEMQVLESGEVIEREVSVPRPDGAVYDRILIKFPVKSAGGSIAAIGTVAVDITDMKRIERELRDARDDLEMRVEERTRELTDEITERKSAEEGLRESENRYRALFENAPIATREEDFSKVKARIDALNIDETDDFIAYLDRHPEFVAECAGLIDMVDANEASLKLHKIDDKADFLANFTSSFSDQALRSLKDVLVAIHNGETSLEFETYVVRADGSRRDVIARWSVAPGHEISCSRILFISVDITEPKHAEEALKESEERFRVAFENAPVGVALITLEGNRFKVNKALADFLGYSVEELTDTEIKSTAADFDDLGESLRLRQQILDGKFTTYRNERRYRHKQGHVVWGEVSGSLFRNKDGEPEHFIAHTIDITDRKQAEEGLRESEERLRGIVENSPAAIFLKDLEGRYQLVTRQFEEWYGVTAADVLGKTSHHVFSKEYADAFVAQDREALESSSAVERESDVPFSDGTMHRVVITKFPVFDAEGRQAGVGTIHTDVTAHRVAEEQLHQAQKMEAVGQLTAGVAHDFNNILAVILGNTELLEDDLGEDNPQLAAVFRATERAADLTQRLLAFSRKQVLNPEIVNANNLITNITGLLRRTLEEHIDIEAVTAAGLWNCKVDPAQLENALVNLAINARDAMPDGGKLTIETANARLDDDYAAAQAEVTPGQFVMLAVTDTGTGMPPEIREHAFEPFFTTKAVGAGSGLGLSMVYGFVKQSGGHVTIYSEKGEGTTIKLYLPRSTETEAVEMKPVTDEVPVARGETVLVVEDDPEVRMLAVALLGSLGYQVTEAASGPAAMEQVESATRLNLLLTDVMLPGGMNGREVAAEIERRVPGIKVLYMSGYTENAIMHHGRLDASLELLQKPFRRADLARAVRRVLDGPSA
jgi:PAS domain S-box-containing protein